METRPDRDRAPEAAAQAGAPDVAQPGIAEALERLAQGDVSTRLPRTYTHDAADKLARAFNRCAEQLAGRAGTRRPPMEQPRQPAPNEPDASSPRSLRADNLGELSRLVGDAAGRVGALGGALTEQCRERETLLNIIEDGALVVEPDGFIRSANRALGVLLGVDPEDLVGRPLADLVAGGVVVGRELMDLAVDGKRSADVPLLDGHGGRVELVATGGALRGGPGEPAGVMLVFRDERALRAARAQAVLGDRLRAVGSVAAGVAHDIRNNLTYIIGNVDFIGSEVRALASSVEHAGRRAGLLSALQDAATGATRAGSVVADLTTFSRVHDRVEDVDLNRLLDATTNLLASEIRRRATIVRDYGEIPRVRANAGSVQHALIALVRNAAQAIPEGASDTNEIRLSTRVSPDGAVIVEVTDTGEGVTERDRIFEPHYTTRPSGAGLGLPTARSLIHPFGGTLENVPSPGPGSTFRLVLPTQPPVEVKLAPETPSAGARRPRVLVVDDEPLIGRSVVRLLGQRYDVVVASSGPQALTLLGAGEFDVILCDVMMPEMSGVELQKHVKAAFPRAAEKMAFMSGGAYLSRERGLQQPLPSPLLAKPFEGPDLRAFVDGLAGAAAP